MADWGVGIYENDDAMDWIYDLLDSSGMTRVKHALDVILQDNSGPFEIADCRIALAAADLVAGLDGEMNPNMPEEAEEWINMTNRSASGLRAKAEDVVHKIMEDSDLRSHVDEKGNLEEWEKTIKALLRRLEY